ncbi:hypothetical protein AC579_6678 [Pseudocercospora musae]|uniref:Uncharacterized protein n=1 Tax=Pseudocercospora musae TaxID=113226 RepID=A0A139IPS9_9PEZI|nr:hypothetical protein AC579_6678 [Pseudocercospora musae]
MSQEEAKGYVLEMIELTWEVKNESIKVMKALTVEEVKAQDATKQAAAAEAMELEEVDKNDERSDHRMERA